MTKKSKLVLAMASMLGITAGATAVSGFAWFTTTKSATVDITNIGVYSKSSALSAVFHNAIKGCTNDSSTEGDINVVGATGTATTDTFKVSGSQTVFTLKQYASAQPTVKVDGVAYSAGTVTWAAGNTAKTVTLSVSPDDGAVVTMEYTPYAALTDVSSVDGQNIYKPTWTASGEGIYATNIPAATEGYLSFSMTLTASGSSDLAVYLNQPHITAATADPADVSAAAITRVALIEDIDKNPATANTTKLVLQNSIASNKGIDEDFIDDGPTYDTSDPADAVGDLFDLSTLTSTVDSDVFAIPDATNKSTMSTAPTANATNNFVCTVDAGDSKDIIVVVWLEGTCGNTGSGPNGKFAQSPENGMINIQLPLIAF